LLASGRKAWYTDDSKTPSGRAYFDLADGRLKPVDVPEGVWSAEVAKKSNGVVKKNSGASLIDLGDGVGCIQFHSKMNALGADIISLTLQALKPGGAGDGFDAFVIANDAQNFSVGANLMLLLMSVHPPVSRHDAGNKILAETSGGSPVWAYSRWRLRDFATCCGSPAARGTVYGTGGSRCRPASWRRWV